MTKLKAQSINNFAFKIAFGLMIMQLLKLLRNFKEIVHGRIGRLITDNITKN